MSGPGGMSPHLFYLVHLDIMSLCNLKLISLETLKCQLRVIAVASENFICKKPKALGGSVINCYHDNHVLLIPSGPVN